MKSAAVRVSVCVAAVATALFTGSGPGSAAPAAVCTSADRVAGAQTYLSALVDPAYAYDVPVADDVIRFENGLQTGFNGDVMQAELALHLQYSGITALTNERWSGSGDLVRVIYDLDYGVAGRNLADATVDETFEFDNRCLIQRIDATISIRPGDGN
jgi:hypothetical protein